MFCIFKFKHACFKTITFFSEKVASIRFNFYDMLSEFRDNSQKMEKILRFTQVVAKCCESFLNFLKPKELFIFNSSLQSPP